MAATIKGSVECLCCILLILLCALPARARPAKGAAADAAQAQQEVLTALSLGNPGHALEIIDRAFRADPDPAFLYQLGLVAQAQLTPGGKQTLVALLSLSPITLLLLQSKSLPVTTAQAVYKALVDAVRTSHLAPLPQARLNAVVHKQSADCLEQPDCQYAVAEEAQARAVLWVAVKETDAKEATPLDPAGGCTVTISYVDINAGPVTSTAEAKSPVCSGVTLSDVLAAVLERLLTDANARPRGMVSVTSVPIGARVRVDGLLRGQTPYLKASFGGVHQIVVEKIGFQAFQSKAEETVGQVATVRAELGAIPQEPPEPAPAPLQSVEVQAPPAKVIGRDSRPRWRLALGGGALGGGLFVAGLGVSALTSDGQCAQPPAEGGFCRGTYSTGAMGGGLLGAGLALTVGGVVLLALPGHMKKE